MTQLWWLTLRAPLGLDEAKMRSMSMVLSMRPSSLQSRHSLLNLGPSSSSRCCRVPKLAKLQKIFFRSSAHPPSPSQHLSLGLCTETHESSRAGPSTVGMRAHGQPVLTDTQ